MNRTTFLNNPAASDFTSWLANECDTLAISLDIKASRFVPMRIVEEIKGLDAVLPHYVWRSEESLTGQWAETQGHLGELAGALKAALGKGDNEAVMAACRRILVWGGERNPKVGASPFLADLRQKDELAQYLNKARLAFKLDQAIIDDACPAPVARMNSMLTKVHALASDDGLPIYDSRVAAAMASLIELWRRARGLQDNPLPVQLAFPATMASRTVQHLFPGAKTPGVMSYAPRQTEKTARQWSGAKIRLGWIMADVLRKAPTLFTTSVAAEARERMHAFEATLFIIGYDVACLRKNSSSAGVDENHRRNLMAAARGSLASENRELQGTSISTLNGVDKKLHYAGNVETGISGIWGGLSFAFERDFLQELLANFQSITNVELGASVTGEVRDNTLGRWIDDHHPTMSRKYVSAIAAILVNEGLATRVPDTRPIQLNFQ